jgi:hypothetical protein
MATRQLPVHNAVSHANPHTEAKLNRIKQAKSTPDEAYTAFNNFQAFMNQLNTQMAEFEINDEEHWKKYTEARDAFKAKYCHDKEGRLIINWEIYDSLMLDKNTKQKARQIRLEKIAQQNALRMLEQSDKPGMSNVSGNMNSSPAQNHQKAMQMLQVLAGLNAKKLNVQV